LLTDAPQISRYLSLSRDCPSGTDLGRLIGHGVQSGEHGQVLLSDDRVARAA
jgi:hypothetical protein